MPHYFFHTADGHSYKDKDGLELRDGSEAQYLALKMFGDLIKDNAQEILTDGHFQLCLTDDQGLNLLEVMLVATKAPGAGGGNQH